ncbi:MAG: xanthine dehydrogenase family protein molybdopterin-binding subunit [Alphaproteobacteria bacterium]|nr:xanthine dehydrogenase family protein molybdopterin-binding subunit [Alphaproteobacteria bacterium]
MSEYGFGKSVRRVEDDRLLVGQGRFHDDLEFDGQTYAVVVRSPHAHARLGTIDVAAARAAPGVIGVFTGADAEKAGIGHLPSPTVGVLQLKRADGSPAYVPPRPVLATAAVKHVGDPVVLVVAESLQQAHDAADLVNIDYDMLPSLTDTAVAANPGVTQIWANAPQNTCFEWAMGDAAATDAAFAKADHVTAIDVINNRVICASMEPRGATGAYDAASGTYTLHTNCQNVFQLGQVAAGIIGTDEQHMHVLTDDVGGGFGMKGYIYAEQILVLWAAKALDRPVKWYGDRSESFVSDAHGRDHVTHAELAMTKGGDFLGLRVKTVASLGAYANQVGPLVPTLLYSRMLPGLYRIPAALAQVTGVFTNTVVTDAYRGAGRPEATYVIERLVDKAARELKVPAEDLRNRNYIRPEDMPYTTAMGLSYDSGDFARNLRDALSDAGQDDVAARRDAAARRGKLLGFGVATYIEATGADPTETAKITFKDDGRVLLDMGTLGTGQGHPTTFAQFVNEALGIEFDKIDFRQGDNRALPQGGGTAGSRSLVIGGNAVLTTADKVLEKARKVAAHMLEAAESDLEFEDGTFTIAGTDRTISIMDVAKAAKDQANLPDGMTPGLDETGDFTYPVPTFPNGAHICEVEIDDETGQVAITRYTVVDDFGKVINPMLVAGQVHGGIAQGMGQALFEHAVYDDESGQLLSGSFMDYCMPRADDLPFIDFRYNEILCQTNPLGAKGAGEAGTLGALPAVVNAILDALAPLGVEHIDMPATPERVWRTMAAAKAA